MHFVRCIHTYSGTHIFLGPIIYDYALSMHYTKYIVSNFFDNQTLRTHLYWPTHHMLGFFKKGKKDIIFDCIIQMIKWKNECIIFTLRIITTLIKEYLIINYRTYLTSPCWRFPRFRKMIAKPVASIWKQAVSRKKWDNDSQYHASDLVGSMKMTLFLILLCPQYNIACTSNLFF